MCTVSWVHTERGYELFCNRDEKHTRAVAAAPKAQWRSGVRFIAPTDGDAGGTWIAVNEAGLTLCLLNAGVSAARKSRGSLVHELAGAVSANEVFDRARSMDLPVFAPFTLAALQAEQPASLLEWDGEELIVTANADHRMPLVSSSFDMNGVETERRSEFLRRAAGGVDARVLRTFHASHGLGASAYSTCMHRADASTVSFSQVRVSKEEVAFRYMPSAPCRHAPGVVVRMARGT